MRYRFDAFEFDPDNLQLIGPEGDIPLRPMTLRLLHALVRDAPQLLRHDQLLDVVWGRQAVTQGVVSQSIRELRQALGDSAQQPRFIETKHRLGYRFIAGIEVLGDAVVAPQAAERADGPSAPEPGRASSVAGRWRLPVAAAAIAAAALLAWSLSVREDAVAPGSLRDAEVVHDGRPREPQALGWYRDGLRALRDGDLGQARELLNRSLEREPGAVAAMAALGAALAQAGDVARAKEWAAAAQSASGNLPRDGQLRVAAFRARLDYRWDQAEEHLQALFQLNPGDAESGYRLAEAQLAAGRLEAAESTLARLAALDLPGRHRFRTAMLQARLATARGDHAARLEHATRAGDLAAEPAEQLEAGLERAWAELLLGRPDAAREQLASLQAREDGRPVAAAVRLAMLEATLEREGGDFDRARQRFADAADRASRIGQDMLAARALREAAYVQVLAGQAAAAAQSLGPVVNSLRQQGDVRELASAQDVLALALQRSGDPAGAQAASEAALDAYLAAGDRIGEAAARVHLGTQFARTGRMGEAREQWEAAHSLFESIGDRRGVATTLSNLAILHGHAGRASAAREANEAALDAFRVLGALPEVARIQFNMGLQDRGAGRLADALARFREAHEVFGRVGAGDFLRQATATLAELHLAMADLEGAERLLAAMGDDETAAVQPRAALAGARARLSALRGDFESAESGFGEARRLRADAGLMEGVQLNELDLAEVAARRGRLAEAEQKAREARRAMLDAGNTGVAIQAGILLAGVMAARGEREPVSRLLDELESERKSYPDAMQALRLDLVRAAIQLADRDAALRAVADSARAIGFELLALRAELLAGGELGLRAGEQLQALGVALEGMPPPLPY